MRDVREAAALALALLALAFLVGHCVGCDEGAWRVRNAEVNLWYAEELDRCRERGRLARSYEVYEACAHAVDTRTCNLYRVRCPDFDGGD